MKAVLSVEKGGPETLVIRDEPSPAPGPGEVRIRVRAVGMNFPDGLIIEDKYQFKPERPFSPGAEVAGDVDAVGDGVTEFSPGDRVLALTLWGGLAEQICVVAEMCHRLPDTVSYETAAVLQMAYGTAYYGLVSRGGLKPGDRLLVLGAAGGVGLAAVQLGYHLGAEVIAAVSTHEKGEVTLKHGARSYVIAARELPDRDATKAQTNAYLDALTNKKSDIVFDTVGGGQTEASLRTLDWLGRLLVVGFPAGIAKLPTNLALLKSVDIRGVFWGEAVKRDPAAHHLAMDTLLDLCATGKLAPHIHRNYPLEDVRDAFTELAAGTVVGKVVVTL